jgi:molybdate/tungstate transport system permease protein
MMRSQRYSSRSRHQRRERPAAFVIAFTLAGALLLAFILLPLLSILLGTSPSALLDVIWDSEVQTALGVTFYAAGWATALALITGVPLAYLLARHQFRGKSWVEGIIDLPIVIPHTAAGIALLMVFSQQAVVGKFLGSLGIGFVDEISGIVVAMLFVSLPFLVDAARETFCSVDVELEQMAALQGASRWQVFRHITLPLTWRGVLAGAVLMWGRGISEFGAVVILAYHPKTIPVLVFERFAGFGLHAALPVAALLILTSLFLFVLLRVLLAPHG